MKDRLGRPPVLLMVPAALAALLLLVPLVAMVASTFRSSAFSPRMVFCSSATLMWRTVTRAGEKSSARMVVGSSQ